MKQIPLRMLRQEAVLCHVETDDYGQETGCRRTALKRVCVEPVLRRKHSKDGEDDQPEAMLYVDAVISQPKGILLLPGDLVEWDGLRWRVTDVKRLHAHGRLHHQEVTLGNG